MSRMGKIWESILSAVAAVVILAILIGIVLLGVISTEAKNKRNYESGASACEARWKAHMIRLGIAEYDRVTGQWKWVNPEHEMDAVEQPVENLEE